MEHLERISKIGDLLEVLEATVHFEYFRGWLVEGLGDGHQLPKLVLGVTFADGIGGIAKPTDRQPKTAAA